jgi:hypothetical protein
MEPTRFRWKRLRHIAFSDAEVPENKSFGVRQWQTCRVQNLGLPVRWNDLTNFSSEVSRLVLLSDRGRTHGSI